MAASNDKIPKFVIGKPLTPRCFKGVKNKHCWYCSQKKALMNSDLFIALNVDNCPVHLDVNDLQVIELVFLTQNTTSHTQPMDQGVI